VDPSAHARCVVVGKGRVVDGGKNSGPNTSKAWGCGLDPIVDDAEAQALVDRIERFYAEGSRRTGVMLAPAAAAPFQKTLRDRAYVFDGLNAVMTHDLGGLPRTARGVALALDIAPTTDLTAFAEVAELAFGAPPPGTTHREIGRPFMNAPYRFFIARHGGEPVGMAGYVTVDDTALFLAAGTRPSHRGRGVQGALLSYRLERCRDENLQSALVHVAPESSSMRNLARAGFSARYTQTRLLGPARV